MGTPTDRRCRWDEDAQSWEDGSGRGGTHAATPPPPPRQDLRAPRALSRGPHAHRPPATTSPATPPGSGSGTRRRHLWPVVGVATVVAATVTLVLVRPTDNGTPWASGPDTPAAPGPSAPGPSAPPANGLPGGLRPVEDELGFSTVVPKGWDRSDAERSGGTFQVDYDGPATARFLRVARLPQPDSGQLFEDAREMPGFEEVTGPESYRTEYFEARRLEYRIREGDDTWHVVDDRFQAVDNHLYRVAAYGIESDHPAREARLARAATRHFCPPNATCAPLPNTP